MHERVHKPPQCDYCDRELTAQATRYYIEKDHREFQIMGTIDVCLWCDKEVYDKDVPDLEDL